MNTESLGITQKEKKTWYKLKQGSTKLWRTQQKLTNDEHSALYHNIRITKGCFSNHSQKLFCIFYEHRHGCILLKVNTDTRNSLKKSQHMLSQITARKLQFCIYIQSWAKELDPFPMHCHDMTKCFHSNDGHDATEAQYACGQSHVI